MSETVLDPQRLVATLAARNVSLELGNLDVCFAALLHLRARHAGLTSLSEEQLIDAFELVCDTLEPGAENWRARATHAIRRLREQRLLMRVDGAGLMRAGEFALSRLATGIVEFYLEEEVLTPDSLTLLARTLMASIAEVMQAARRADTPQAWREAVVGPLRITVSDLVDGIERRQRGLDVQQEEFQRRIALLLEADWFGAIEQCQALLESTATTLRELGEILLRDTHQLQTQLQTVQELALEAQAVEAEGVAQRVIDQIDRITAWGSARQRAWSEYYEYVHRYLRDVVRLDPSRALTERLRAQLNSHKLQPFALTVACAPALCVLRPVEAPRPPPPVRRPRQEREEPLGDAEPTADPRAQLETQVKALLAQGVSDLSELTARVTRGLASSERFLWAGRVAQIVAELKRPLASIERPWVSVDEELMIEQWRLPLAEGS